MQQPIVCKFGGSSAADADGFRRIRNIVRNDARRKFIIVSAPGRRLPGNGNTEAEEKLTNLLLRCHAVCRQGGDPTPILKTIFDRYREIARELELEVDLEPEYARIAKALPARDAAYAASRGEYLCGLLLASYLQLPFVDASKMVCFDASGHFDANLSESHMRVLRAMGGAVLPGFYGAAPDGRICTFPRGGSDITGALVAKAVNASTYENWTDVNGLLSADPGIVPNPISVQEINYKQMKLLAQSGAGVLHTDCLRPVAETGILTRIRNTFAPELPGTLISDCHSSTVPCVAGRGGFISLNIQLSEEITARDIHSTLFAADSVPLAADICATVFRGVFSKEKISTALETLWSAFPSIKIWQGPNLAKVAIIDPANLLSSKALRRLGRDTTEANLIGLNRLPNLQAWHMYCHENKLTDFVNAVYLVLYS